MTTEVQQRKARELPQTLPQTGFVRLPTVLRFFPVSRSSWWAGVRCGKYPQSVKLGPRTTAWRAEDLCRLIKAPPQSTTVAISTAPERREGVA